MSVGFPANRPVIDAQAGRLALDLRNTLEAAQRFKTWLDGKSSDDLEALGYSEQDVALLKSGATDLDRLARVAFGQEIQAAPSDFFFWARNFTGPN